jgi:hypothetical protein
MARLPRRFIYLKLSFSKRLRGQGIGAPGSPLRWANLGSEKLGSFWQKRYYDRNVRDAREFAVKLRYTGVPSERRFCARWGGSYAAIP